MKEIGISQREYDREMDRLANAYVELECLTCGWVGRYCQLTKGRCPSCNAEAVVA